MALWLYSALWYALTPLLFVRLWWRGRRAPAYRGRWRERLARGLGQRSRRSVWIHAVSVGETLAAAPMIRVLLERHPQTPLVVTTTTPTGSDQVRALFGDRVHHVYCPWDTPSAMARFMDAFDPQLILILETELWPNLAAVAAKRGIPLWLVNGRLSARSARGYGRVSALVRPMLQCFTGLMVQTAVEAERFAALGARPEQLQVTGSVKFDIDLGTARQQAAAALRAEIGARPVWLAASTHPGEDAPILAAHQQLRQTQPQALLILVPRHPERFDEVAAQVRDSGLTLARRSQQQAITADTAVYLGDTMGELLMLIGAAAVTLVAGSLVPRGGHNLLEPAAWGQPVLSGPHRFNFEHIAALLEQAGALKTVTDADSLAATLVELFNCPALREALGAAAQAVVAEHAGALERVLETVERDWPR